MNLAPSTTSVLRFPEAGLPERLGPPATLDAAQQEAADELINGPRRGVYGPFRPLLHHPPLLRAVAKVGESLRYEGTLDAALREWTICVVARELSNVFEWDMHLPLAAAAGVPSRGTGGPGCRAAVTRRSARRPRARSHRYRELIGQHRLSDETYSDALRLWGEPTTVELLTLVGYFAMVCWLMNVARTPGPAA